MARKYITKTNRLIAEAEAALRGLRFEGPGWSFEFAGEVRLTTRDRRPDLEAAVLWSQAGETYPATVSFCGEGTVTMRCVVDGVRGFEDIEGAVGREVAAVLEPHRAAGIAAHEAQAAKVKAAKRAKAKSLEERMAIAEEIGRALSALQPLPKVMTRARPRVVVKDGEVMLYPNWEAYDDVSGSWIRYTFEKANGEVIANRYRIDEQGVLVGRGSDAIRRGMARIRVAK